ncbi:MAG: hypothetical protein LRY38_06940 [Aeromonadaceae bacterium]|nr:hypothetical protein [Aeromonadaceae bacterium]
MKQFGILSLLSMLLLGSTQAADLSLPTSPIFVQGQVAPLVMLVMGRDHTLYYEAYNDATDLDDDGKIDTHYNPNLTKGYYGYFDSDKCYQYSNNMFIPVGSTGAKHACSNKWSGDFLNYLTTSRIDALRKVLYGGYRYNEQSNVDHPILERSFIPQDAHSWGKTWDPLVMSQEGLTISNYTELDDADGEYGFFFANTSTSSTGAPLLRILKVKSSLMGRDDDSTVAFATNYPSSIIYFSGTPNNWGKTAMSLVADHKWQATVYFPAQSSKHEFKFDVDGNWSTVYGDKEQDGIAELDSGTNSGATTDIKKTAAGTYKVTFNDQTGAYSLSSATSSTDALSTASNYLYIWNWVSKERPVASNSMDNVSGGIDDYISDYIVRVQVCNSSVGLEGNCKKYGSSASNNKYMPIGLLQEYGEGDEPDMEFGLITGSYKKNLSGGVLRAKMGKISDEINSTTGKFIASSNRIIDALNKLKITNFTFSASSNDYQYREADGCGWIKTEALPEGKCTNWGNPIGEMLYESLRYFAGAKSPTPEFSVSDDELDLHEDTWDDPYQNRHYCAAPINLVISDVGTSYDSDQLPHANASFLKSGFTGSNLSVNVSEWTKKISDNEAGINGGSFFIGEVAGQTDGKNTPTAKTVTSLDTIRGLSPMEPTKQGSYYAAGLAYFGHENVINSGSNKKPQTIVVALASNLPKLELPVGNGKITLIPYAKSVGGQNISALETDFQPTNTIVDFYVEKLSDTEGTFRVNYEDVEQGADHDMDMIVKYHYQVSGNQLTITLISEYAAGNIDQHAGYVISGSTADGLYLDVKDKSGAHVNYYLDTVGNVARKYDSSNSETDLPLEKSRTFTVDPTKTAAGLLESPLWYAAKWGGFNDKNKNGLPDEGEWDTEEAGKPDNYLLVTKASDLEEQLKKAFNAASENARSDSAVSFSGYQLGNDAQAFLAKFEAKTWSGDLQAHAITSGAIATDPSWSAAKKLDARSSVSDRVIITWDGTSKRLFSQPSSLSGSTSGLSADMIDKLLTGITGSAADKLGYVQALVDYLRGDRSKEAGGVQVPIIKTNFRPRSSRLGDIVHSTPVYGKSVDGVPFVVVSANDGMVHVFHADTGEEILAFIPHGIYDKLNQLADVGYDSAHQFYVDGEIKVSSIKEDDDESRVIAVGTFGLGAKGAWALDLSNLSSVSNTLSAADKILWQVDSLGYVPYPPAIAKVKDGDEQRWVAAFGNGYNDGTTAGNSSIKVYDLLSGSLLKTLTSPKGKSDDPTGQSRPNGMAEPVFADSDLNGVADRLYAGDLFGYLWKVDVNKDNISDWDFAIKSDSVIKPLFITQYATDTTPAYEPQPITTRPAVAFHPAGGLMVLVGTGKYLEQSDTSVSNQVTQSLYGLWDNGANDTLSRTNLVKQEITAQATHRTLSHHSIDWSTKQGWHLDLIVKNATSNEGERIVNNIAVRNTKAYLTTLIPNEDLCSGGGKGWYMEINLLTGDNQGLEENSELLDKIPSKPVPKLVPKPNGDVEVSTSVRLDGEDELFESNPTVERTGAVSWLKVY